jgi:CheY-like chemotaxis protein
VASTRKVLVVEDEPAIRGLVSMLLESEGYVVDSASDGQDALAKVRRHPPDALVVDLDLPILNGCDLVLACRADQETRRLLIIAVSGMIGSHMLPSRGASISCTPWSTTSRWRSGWALSPSLVRPCKRPWLW